MRETFNAIEAAAESGDQAAKSSILWVERSINAALAEMQESRVRVKLNGADPCERVAEALAVWLVESDAERFGNMLALQAEFDRLPPRVKAAIERFRKAAPPDGPDADWIAEKWARIIGMGFHPDTRGADYDPPLSPAAVAEYDFDMERIADNGADPYAAALAAFERLGFTEPEVAVETCEHCGEERGLGGGESSLWICGNCNGMNEKKP